MSDFPNPATSTATAVGGSSNADDVVIDIWTEGDLDYNRDRLSSRRVFVNSTAMIVETNLGLAGQAIGAVMATSLSSSATASWPLYLVELLIIIGLSFTYAAITLRRIKPPYLSLIAAKIGAVAVAAAIIISAASQLPPLLALTVTPYALLLILAAVVYA